MFPLRFDYIPYPLWRRRMPDALKRLSRPLLRRWFPVDADEQPPETPDTMVGYLSRWQLLNGLDEANARRKLETYPDLAEPTRPDAAPQPYHGGPVRIPAQWEPLEAVLFRWPVIYPPLWASHAEMVEAVSEVAEATICVPSQMWAKAVRLYLEQRGKGHLDRVRLLELPTANIWVRDYGPIVGLDAAGNQVAVDAIFQPLPNYPQQGDNAMPARWAAHEEIPHLALDLAMEGGNLWSDGAGTLLMSDDLLHRHPHLSRDDIERRLHDAFDFQKLIITPGLSLEETHHVDLLTKLVDAQTILVAAPSNLVNRDKLRRAAAQLRAETNAAGQLYRVVELPMPPLYLNWGVFPIWRSYTNALTVNGRVLVPVFGIRSDKKALDIYRRVMPGHEIIPIQCAIAANGGGAVHCLTKEVPRAATP